VDEAFDAPECKSAWCVPKICVTWRAMRYRISASRAGVLSGLTALVASTNGCGVPEPPPAVAVPPSAILQPTRGIQLRAAFDDDPTIYVGRFIPEALPAQEIDETSAVQTRCSEYYGYKVVNAFQEHDELVSTSRKVAGAIGIKPLAAIGVSGQNTGTVRVHYTLKKRMQVAPKDAGALARFFAAAPDQCSGKVIGEFLMGSGEVYEALGSKAQVEASGVVKPLTGEISFKDDVAWKQVNAFTDMYFAFLTTGAGAVQAVSSTDDGTCSWCDTVPASLDGTYFCGISPPATSETMARDLAMRNAREQVVKFLGEFLTAESETQSSLIQGYLKNTQITATAAAGVASQVKDQKWCKASATSTPEGDKLTSKVLAFFPNAEKKRSAAMTIEAMISLQRTDPKHKEDGAVLRALLQKVK
jgi:hypothetical protein